MTDHRRIPVFEPMIGDKEIANALSALHAGHISGHSGHFIEEFENRFAEFCGAEHAVAVSSGSTALHLAAVIANVRPGDTVMVSALTNIATANAIVQCGAKVVPIDSEPGTWNLDLDLIDEAYYTTTPRPHHLFPVHIYGHPIDYYKLKRLVNRHPELIVVEDAAEAHGAAFEDIRVGTFGDFACFSFYANKIVTTGEGGMIVTNHTAYADRARYLRNLAFREPRFFHVDSGFNYRMTNLQAAIGCGQMDRIDEVLWGKRNLALRYTFRLEGTPGLQLPVERAGYTNVYWMYAIVVDQDEFGISRDELRAVLSGAGIDTRTMFCPLNRQPALSGHIVHRECPVADRLWRDGLYLPSTVGLSDVDLDYVCDTIRGARR